MTEDEVDELTAMIDDGMRRLSKIDAQGEWVKLADAHSVLLDVRLEIASMKPALQPV